MQRLLLLEHSSLTNIAVVVVHTMVNFTLMPVLFCTMSKYKFHYFLTQWLNLYHNPSDLNLVASNITTLFIDIVVFVWSLTFRNICLFQVGSLPRSHSFTQRRFSLVKKSHWSAPISADIAPTYFGSNWRAVPMPAASQLCPALIATFLSVMDLKKANFAWHPTPLCYFLRSNKWILLTLRFISVERNRQMEGQSSQVEHI